MNSLAALSRALSRGPTRPAAPSRQGTRSTLAHDLASYDLPASTPSDGAGELSIKSPESQAIEELEDDEGPSSAYPSPPPTPQPPPPPPPSTGDHPEAAPMAVVAPAVPLPAPAAPLATAPGLGRRLSKKQAAAVERAARSLPVRVAVEMYKLIRQVLALLGIRIAAPPTLEAPIELRIAPATPRPDQPPSYDDAVAKPTTVAVAAAAADDTDHTSRWPYLPFRRRQASPATSSPTGSRRGSTTERGQPAPAALAVLNRRKTLVLDLDETLIHSTSRIVVLDGKSVVYHVYKRPWVDFFLRKVSMWYTVIIFTASMQEYADPVIDWLDGGAGLIEGRHFRESCIYSNGSYIKDLSVLGPEVDLSSTALVDNSPISFARNQANGIPIEGFISDPNDSALLDLLPILDSLRFTSDVRRVLGLRAYTSAPIATGGKM